MEEIAISKFKATCLAVLERVRLTNQPIRVTRTVTECIEWQHSKATLSRVRLGDRTAAFDEDFTDLFRRRGMSYVELDVVGFITWGRPVAK